MNIEKRLKAIKLRKQKKSYSEIATILDVPKSTVSYWFKDIDWSKNIKNQLTARAQKVSTERIKRLNDLTRKKWMKVYENAEMEAISEFNYLKDNPLFLVGLSLYWGEGDKNFKNGIIRLSNVDCKLLSIFNKFLLDICKIEEKKISAYILYYPDLNPKNCLQYWSVNIGINQNKFYKPILIEGRHKTKRLSYGVCSISTTNKYLKKKILTWIDLSSKLF